MTLNEMIETLTDLRDRLHVSADARIVYYDTERHDVRVGVADFGREVVLSDARIERWRDLRIPPHQTPDGEECAAPVPEGIVRGLGDVTARCITCGTSWSSKP